MVGRLTYCAAEQVNVEVAGSRVRVWVVSRLTYWAAEQVNVKVAGSRVRVGGG